MFSRMRMKSLMSQDNMKKSFLKKNKGYTLLFAVLVASVVLSIGISILNISKKEFLIATSARDSSMAFYAADSGVECAIHADDNGVFDYGDENRTGEFYSNCSIPYSFPTVPSFPITLFPGDPTSIATFVFHMKSGSANTSSGPQEAIDVAGKSCAIVTVKKQLVIVNSKTVLRTTIDSQGYNTGWHPDSNSAYTLLKGTCDLSSAKRVEREIVYTF